MKLSRIAETIGARVTGDADLEITGVAALESAGPADISLYLGRKYLKDLEKTGARALVVAPGKGPEGFSLIEVDRPRLRFIEVIELFHAETRREGVHPTAVIAGAAFLGENVAVGAGACVGERSTVGDGSEIHERVVIYEDVKIGRNCRIQAGVVIREGTEIGDNVIIQPGAVIGADGFGFEPDEAGVYHKIPQVGRVVIEDDVEIGANTCIDRAALGETRIGKGTKIDNLCQLGHGDKIGRHSVISGMTGIGGSTTVGNHVVIGGGAGLADHITIGDGVMVAGRTGITGSVPAGSIVAGFPHEEFRVWKRAMAILYRTAKQRGRRLEEE